MAETVSFSADILPLFTSTDIAHMKPMGVLLAEYDWMSVPPNATNVYGQLSSGNMPPGSPWPEPQVSLFQSWMDGGYQP